MAAIRSAQTPVSAENEGITRLPLFLSVLSHGLPRGPAKVKDGFQQVERSDTGDSELSATRSHLDAHRKAIFNMQ